MVRFRSDREATTDIRSAMIEKFEEVRDRHPTWTVGEFDYVRHWDWYVQKLIAGDRMEFHLWEAPKHIRGFLPGSHPSDRWVLEADDSVSAVDRY